MAQTKVVSEKTKWEAGIFTLSPEFPPYPAVTRNRILSLLERLSELLLERQDRHHSAVMRASPRSVGGRPRIRLVFLRPAAVTVNSFTFPRGWNQRLVRL